MSIRSFVAGILAGLVLGGVAWGRHAETEGSGYFVHGTGDLALREESLDQARDEYDRAKARLEARNRRDPFRQRDLVVELIEQRCQSRVLDSYGP